MNNTRSSALPASVWMLGLVSLLMDTSSEMIHSLLPVFLVTVVGASAATLGLIEGVAEATAQIVKVFSGVLSDRFRSRKPLTLFGYALAALTKPLFPLADSALTVLLARFMDRVGKGIRGAPRDALVADVTPPEQRGAAFGLRQSLDTVGAFLGPLLAIALMLMMANDMRRVFWFAVIPAVLCVLLLWLGVREPAQPRAGAARPSPFAGLRAGLFPPAFWRLAVVVGLFTLARFSEAFLILRTQTVGVAPAYIPLAFVLMNAVYMVAAYPAGKLSDRLPRKDLLMWGCAVLALADLCLGFGSSVAWIAAGIALWGLHMGLTEGLIAALVADHAPRDLTATAFGVVNLARGVLMLIASAVAGAVWTLFGPTATFVIGLVFSVATAAAVRRL